MNWKTPLILLIVLIAIAGYFFLVEQPRREQERSDKISSRKILPYGIDEVLRVSFTNPAGDRIDWIRDGDAWTITYPTRTPGSTSTIDYFISQMIPGQKRNEFDPGDDLETYGLSRPYATVVFTTEERTDSLFIGDATPLSSQCYVRRSGSDKIYVARDLTRNLVNKNLYHLRDKSFLTLEPDSITALRVSSGDRTFTFDRQPGTWMIRGTRLGADRKVIEPYLTGLTDAITREFSAEDLSDLARFGLGPERGEITIFTGSDSTVIAFGDSDDEFTYVVRNGLDKVVRIEKRFDRVFEWLDEKIMVLNVSYFDPARVARITWETAGSGRSIYLEDGVWRSELDGTIEIPVPKLSYFLVLIRGLVFEQLGRTGFLPADGPPPESTVRITLSGSDGSILDTVTISGTPDGTLTAGSLSSGSFGTVRDGNFEEIVRVFERLYNGLPREQEGASSP